MADLPVNPYIAAIDRLVAALLDGGVIAAESFLAVEAPPLELPVIRLFTNEVLQALASAIQGQLQKAVAAAVIDVQTNFEASAAGQAVTALQSAQASGDPNAIAQANDDFDQAMASLISFDGTAPRP